MNAEPARRYSRWAAEELKGRTYGETASRYRTRGGAPERSRVYPSREGQNAISLPEVTRGGGSRSGSVRAARFVGSGEGDHIRFDLEAGSAVERIKREPPGRASPS